MANSIIATEQRDIKFAETADSTYSVALRLHALLAMTYGCQGDSFRAMNDDLQDRFLWQCAEMANEVMAGLEAMATGEMARA